MSFPDLLAQRQADSPGRPLVTSYDDATGERTELSVTTYANWVAKTAGVLVEDCDLDPGMTVRVALPEHWLVPVFLGAAWTAGLAVTTDDRVAADLVVTGPDTPSDAPSETPSTSAAASVLACSLHPFATRFAEGPPAGALDFGVLWPGQPDDFMSLEPVGEDTVAWRDAAGELTQGELLARAEGGRAGLRLLTDLHPAADHGVPAFLRPLVADGSVVLVRHAEEARWPARREDERATEELRAGGQPASA